MYTTFPLPVSGKWKVENIYRSIWRTPFRVLLFHFPLSVSGKVGPWKVSSIKDRGGGDHLVRYVVWLSAPGMLFLSDGGVVWIQLEMLCDPQLQVWYFYWIEGGDHSVWNIVWFSAPGMIFLLDRGGWSFSLTYCVILSSRYDISIGWWGLIIQMKWCLILSSGFYFSTYHKWKNTFPLSPFH